MKKSRYIIAISVVMMLTACGKKKQPVDNIIIAEPPKEEKAEAPASTQEGDYTQERSIDWAGEKYNVVVTRAKDETLPSTTDEEGKVYYDNKISVKVMRSDGTEVFNRDFTKKDFIQYCGEMKAAKDGALLGIVLDKVEGDKLVFAASVGSPDASSDEYCPLKVTLSRSGSYSIDVDNSPRY